MEEEANLAKYGVKDLNEKKKRDTYKPSDYNAEAAFRSTTLRSKLFKDTIGNMKPSQAITDRYSEFLKRSYEQALKKQLNVSYRSQTDKVRTRYSNLGFASGALRKSITVSVEINYEAREDIGRFFVDYELTPSYLQYGDAIAGGRRRSVTKGNQLLPALVRWIERKIKLGSFRVYTEKKGKGNLNRKNEIESIAARIRAHLSMSNRPPVLPDWHTYAKNPQLRKDFKAIIAKEQKKYLGQIRKDLIKQINKQYGK